MLIKRHNKCQGSRQEAPVSLSPRGFPTLRISRGRVFILYGGVSETDATLSSSAKVLKGQINTVMHVTKSVTILRDYLQLKVTQS